MSSVKCPQCGLVNWSNTETCKRCQAVLPAVSQEEPQHTPPPPLGWQQTEQLPHQEPQQQPTAWQPPASYSPYPSYADYRPATDSMMVLASRGSRLGAALLDSACFIVPVILGAIIFMLIGKGLGAGDEVIPVMMVGVIGVFVLAMVIIQFYLLSKDGQTIGKKVLSIRIVKVETGENGGFVTNALMRSILPGLIGGVPLVGPLFRLADVLFIFREDQRCLHDLMAGTCVIKA